MNRQDLNQGLLADTAAIKHVTSTVALARRNTRATTEFHKYCKQRESYIRDALYMYLLCWATDKKRAWPEMTVAMI